MMKKWPDLQVKFSIKVKTRPFILWVPSFSCRSRMHYRKYPKDRAALTLLLPKLLVVLRQFVPLEQPLVLIPLRMLFLVIGLFALTVDWTVSVGDLNAKRQYWSGRRSRI